MSLAALAVVSMLVLSVALGAPSTPVPEQEIVKALQFSGGEKYDGKGVPEAYKPLVETIKGIHPKATFGLKEKTLLIGLPVDAKATATVVCKSDCPVNSQFNVDQKSVVLAEANIEKILVSWTKVRHPWLKDQEVERRTLPKDGNGHAEIVLKKLEQQ